MTIENFIRDALFKPSEYVAYHVGRELAELHPGKSIVEGENGYFDLESFVRAGKCSIIEEKSVFNHVRTEWRGAGRKQRERIQNAWLNVLWQGQLMNVVLLTWAEGRFISRHHWIVADDKKLAQEFFDAVCEWGCQVRGEILVYQDGYFDKDQDLFHSIKTSTFENLILQASFKERIQNDFAQFFNSRDVYERYGIPWKRGAIFIGPPGNGKTHTLKALINQLGQPCLYVRSFKSECGTEQGNMSEVFRRARMSPCVVVLEDLDSMIDDDNRSFFLNEIDGFQPNTGVVVLATTNHPEKLDSSILDRPSRFDRKYYFQLPEKTERLAYIDKWNGALETELRLSRDGVTAVAGQTEGFSFAYLKELLVASTVQWISQGCSKAMDDVVLAQAGMLREEMNAVRE